VKIAVASSGTSLDSWVDEHTGRAAFIIIYDTESEHYAAHDNFSSLDCIHWAGPRIVDFLTHMQVDSIIVRRIGPSAFRKLSDARVKVYYVDKVAVVDAIKRLREGSLTLARSPNCPGHEHLHDSPHSNR
jgi:predicted Fe-Mo cluster-binding NifX family protein